MRRATKSRLKCLTGETVLRFSVDSQLWTKIEGWQTFVLIRDQAMGGGQVERRRYTRRTNAERAEKSVFVLCVHRVTTCDSEITDVSFRVTASKHEQE